MAPLIGWSNASDMPKRERQPYRKVQPDTSGAKFGLHRQHQRHDDVADDDDDEIGRQVIGAMVMQGLAASRAVVV